MEWCVTHDARNRSTDSPSPYSPRLPILQRTVTCMRLSSGLQSRGGGSVALPSLDPAPFSIQYLPNKKSLHRENRYRDAVFHPYVVSAAAALSRGTRAAIVSFRQVFWLAGSSYSLRLPGLLTSGSFRSFHPRLQRRVRSRFQRDSLGLNTMA